MALPPDVLDIIGKSLGDDVGNYDLDLLRGNSKGTGYLGEVIFVTAVSKSTKDETHLVIKKIVNYSRGLGEVIKASFKNEIYFYGTFLRKFLEFQTSEVFDKFPKCYATCSDEKEQKIVLENLSFSGFKMVDGRKPVDRAHVELMFETYGRFHGTSFAFKHLKPEEYKELAVQFVDVTKLLILGGVMPNFDRTMKGYLMVKGGSLEEGLRETCERYAKDGKALFEESLTYGGGNSIVLHGDCHNLNMLFKYDADNNPVDIRLLDFQLCKSSTPVSDLSYCLFASGSPEVYGNYDHYLKLYHESLTKTLKLYDLDSSDVYPFDTLKEEWKSHGKFGLIMAGFVWMGRTMEGDDIIDLEEYQEMREKISDDVKEQLRMGPFSKPTFVKIFDGLVRHGHETGLL